MLTSSVVKCARVENPSSSANCGASTSAAIYYPLTGLCSLNRNPLWQLSWVCYAHRHIGAKEPAVCTNVEQEKVSDMLTVACRKVRILACCKRSLFGVSHRLSL